MCQIDWDQDHPRAETHKDFRMQSTLPGSRAAFLSAFYPPPSTTTTIWLTACFNFLSACFVIAPPLTLKASPVSHSVRDEQPNCGACWQVISLRSLPRTRVGSGPHGAFWRGVGWRGGCLTAISCQKAVKSCSPYPRIFFFFCFPFPDFRWCFNTNTTTTTSPPPHSLFLLLRVGEGDGGCPARWVVDARD